MVHKWEYDARYEEARVKHLPQGLPEPEPEDPALVPAEPKRRELPTPGAEPKPLRSFLTGPGKPEPIRKADAPKPRPEPPPSCRGLVDGLNEALTLPAKYRKAAMAKLALEVARRTDREGQASCRIGAEEWNRASLETREFALGAMMGVLMASALNAKAEELDAEPKVYTGEDNAGK